MTKKGKLQKKDVGIHAYFNGYEYADGHIYVGDEVFLNKVYNMRLTSKRACQRANKMFKKLAAGRHIDNVLENIDEILLEMWM